MNSITMREEAVAYLRSFDVFAVERDWSLGETIFVASEPIGEKIDISSFYRRAVYIYPKSCHWPRNDEKNSCIYRFWSIDDMKNAYVSDKYCVPLREACDVAIKLLRGL